MLGRAEVRYYVKLLSRPIRQCIVVEVERNTVRAAVDVNRSILKAKPLPELARQRRRFGQQLDDAGDCLRLRHWQAEFRRHAEELSKELQPVTRAEKGVRELLRANLHDGPRGRHEAALAQANQQFD